MKSKLLFKEIDHDYFKYEVIYIVSTSKNEMLIGKITRSGSPFMFKPAELRMLPDYELRQIADFCEQQTQEEG